MKESLKEKRNGFQKDPLCLGSPDCSSIGIEPRAAIRDQIEVPGDKSISHRSLLFGALAEGVTEIRGLLNSGDVRSTWSCLEQFGVEISGDADLCRVFGKGKNGRKGKNAWRLPLGPLDCGNSGTTLRLLMGVLAGFDFQTILTGDDSLRRRPMSRVAEPLRHMGATIRLTEDRFAPAWVQGARVLKGLQWELPVASAQLKSALLLAGLFAEGTQILTGKIQSRDHSERLLPAFGVVLQQSNGEIRMPCGQNLQATQVQVPGDFSSASFWIALGLLLPHSELEIRNVSLNPTRLGFLRVVERMGAQVETEVIQQTPEPIGHLRVRSSLLQGTQVLPSEIASLIDELPLLAVLAATAEGVTSVRGAEELRIKESDRIEAVALNLRAMGGRIETQADGFTVQGVPFLKGSAVESFGDHRIAMAFAVAASGARGPSVIQNADCVGISYPQFFQQLFQLRG